MSGIDFTFPPNVELTAGDSLLLIRDKVTPAVFRSVYNVPASVEIFAYSGELDNSAETLVLKKPGMPEAQTGYVPMIAVEQVKYNDSAPWPIEADGLGKSLHRINTGTYANDVANWRAADASYIPLMYSLTVNSGTGDGDYTEGTIVPIQAETVPQHTFVSWAGDVSGILNETGAATTLTMPASDVTITATYVSNIMYRLTVNDGSGDGEYISATVVPVEAVQNNLAFVRWIGNVSGVDNVLNSTTTLTMPAQNITLTALHAETTRFFDEGAVWKYHDQGQDLGTAWQSSSYDDSEWDEGAAQLGYGDGDEATVLSYGGDNNNKYVTTYFRKNFSVSDPSLVSYLTLRLLRDDGAVVYINGIEVARDRMGTGTVDYQTLSPETQVGGDEEDTFYEFSLAPSALVPGSNVMAVEIHQNALNSSDISFDAELTGFLTVDPATMDGDADGLYDAWEVDQFGSTEQGLPDVDSDGDGFWNVEEFIAGTQPNDSNSYFRIDGFDGANVWWNEVSGRTYSVHWTEDLDTPFVPVSFDAAGGTYTDTSHPTHSAGFYQITVEME